MNIQYGQVCEEEGTQNGQKGYQPEQTQCRLNCQCIIKVEVSVYTIEVIYHDNNI